MARRRLAGLATSWFVVVTGATIAANAWYAEPGRHWQYDMARVQAVSRGLTRSTSSVAQGHSLMEGDAIERYLASRVTERKVWAEQHPSHTLVPVLGLGLFAGLSLPVVLFMLIRRPCVAKRP